MNKVMIATDSASDLNSLFEERDIKLAAVRHAR